MLNKLCSIMSCNIVSHEFNVNKSKIYINGCLSIKKSKWAKVFCFHTAFQMLIKVFDVIIIM